MKHLANIASPCLVFAAILTAPIASAACDISQTKCALNGGKCNIHFRNRTGDAGGSDGTSGLSQTSSAQTIIVKARDPSGNPTGNSLHIVAFSNKTMNITKKTHKKNGFKTIKLASQDFGAQIASASISCDEVIAVLNGTGICKVFHGHTNTGQNDGDAIGYQCDGGNVGGPGR
ncbi:MAG: hypothetical protein AAFR51_03030 [Pseudomonadota bacterium]